jgi:cyanophycinase-like exopeptidase
MSEVPRILTIMGSGETAPTMMKVHRDLIAQLGAQLATAPRAVVLDTPYGFQENAPELAARAQEYFAKSVGHSLEVAGLQRLHDMDPVMVEQGLTKVRLADYLFAGPGSPTYALRQWSGSAVADLIKEKLRTGGAVTFASAAALTLGRVTVPVYEIYKVGAEPVWLEGLDLLAEANLAVAVIPHYDNAEGGHHDTRFCYLGERRLAMLEESLPDGVHVLGVDEHTGVILDLDADRATVVGNGSITVRVAGHSRSYPTGSVIPIDALRDPALTSAIGTHLSGSRSEAGSHPPASSTQGTGATQADGPTEVLVTSLAAATDSANRDFEQSLQAGDAEGAVRAALALEDAITAWSVDTLQSDESDRARAALRSMILRLGTAAVGGLKDPSEVHGPMIDLIMRLRAEVRAAKNFEMSDLIRDGLAALGVEVRDGREGASWVWSDQPL